MANFDVAGMVTALLPSEEEAYQAEEERAADSRRMQKFLMEGE